MLAQLSRASLLGKARQRPDLAAQVFGKLRRDGIRETWRAVADRLDREIPLGYSLAGEVLQAGEHGGFRPGERVVAAGAGCANHAEVNYVPRLLAAQLPENVDFEDAAYATVGAIAMHGVRNAQVQLGETVAVLGLGLIGQLAVQILAAAGCRVVGVDPDPARIALAQQTGAALALAPSDDRLAAQAQGFTRGRGVDAVLITAATRDNGPLRQAARIARDRARVVMVGVTGMEVPRKAFYEKELSLVVSRSCGPGRYDDDYEQRGRDYPTGYIRWTENRNLEAFLDLVAAGAVDPGRCTTHRFPIDRASEAMALILSGRQPHLGVLLTYPEAASPTSEVPRVSTVDTTNARTADRQRGRTPVCVPRGQKAGISFIGAGAFARGVLLPLLGGERLARLRGVVAATGLSADAARRKFKFDFASTDPQTVLDDAGTHAVVIATPHREHAPLVCRALAAGKRVFVEKPLACDLLQLLAVHDAVARYGPNLMVGFNRRFAPLTQTLLDWFDGRRPLTASYRCSAGRLPSGHWLGDPGQGGRIIGEACHFFDLLGLVIGAGPVQVAALGRADSDDEASVAIRYADGSLGHVIYTAAATACEKERLEVFSAERSAVLEDFRVLRLSDRRRTRRRRAARRQSKGHRHELAAFVAAVAADSMMPIPVDALLTSTLVSLAAVESLRAGQPIDLPPIDKLVETLRTSPSAAGSASPDPPASKADSPTVERIDARSPGGPLHAAAHPDPSRQFSAILSNVGPTVGPGPVTHA
jgi:predicted dehydrogenase